MDLSSWPDQARPLVPRIISFIDNSLANRRHESFETLALDIFQFQREHDPVARALCPHLPRTFADIPSIPVDLFKELPVGTVPQGAAAAQFMTSGTTATRRGIHRMRSTFLYEYNAKRWANTCVPDLPKDAVSLLLDPTAHPESSLSHMISVLAENGTASWHLPDGQVDVDQFTAQLHGKDSPTLVATTAFALADLLKTGKVFSLPAPSVVLVTGGFKGRKTEVSEDALFQQTERMFPGARIVTEYGMTELSSQLWGEPGLPFRPPPWLKVIACDPSSGKRLPTGETGQLRFYDLANLDCAVSIETMDAGYCTTSGAVVLQGRLLDASPRGCSLTVEEARQKKGAL